MKDLDEDLTVPELFEGRALPVGGDLNAALLGGDPWTLGWLVRAAVVDESYADRVSDWALGIIEIAEADEEALGVALRVGAALTLRALVAPVRRRLLLGRPTDSWAPTAFEFVLNLSLPGDPRTHELLVWALDGESLRLRAWRALSVYAPADALPGLAPLLAAEPEHAGECARRLALVHTPFCEPACRLIQHLPEATRRTFADALNQQLSRIGAIKLWVGCRRILFGR